MSHPNYNNKVSLLIIKKLVQHFFEKDAYKETKLHVRFRDLEIAYEGKVRPVKQISERKAS